MSKQRQSDKIGLYMRLSRDDEKAGESMSIEHQRIILQKYVAEQGGQIADEYIDDGWSGTNFERPAVKRMLEDAQSGKIDTIIVKDLSRFGRNYIQVGQYIDYIFPAYGIRFIALNDNVDTSDRSSAAMDMMPIMNVFNEWHAANTSKKIRAVLEASQRSGKYTNWNYPYGYKAGTDDNRTAVIDAEAAAVVKRIYDLRLQGLSYQTISRVLTDSGIPNPATYFTRIDGKKADKQFSPYWCPKTVRCILTNPTYIGSTVQHKTTSVSYKNHKVINVPENKQIVKENAHEAIIGLDIWNKVQEINRAVSASRGRADKTENVHPLSGLLVCGDCGKKLTFKSGGKRCDCFICRTYRDLGKKYCSSHCITEKAITSVVLQDIRSMLKLVTLDETKAKERFIKEKSKNSEQNRYSEEKQLKAYKNRLVELERLIQSAFEEKVLGNLPENVCASLIRKYQAEISATQISIEETEKRLKEQNCNDNEAQEYIERLKRYSMCDNLTREMCLQLIDFILIGAIQEKGGKRSIKIIYKFKSNEK